MTSNTEKSNVTGRRPSPGAIRRALAECLTLEDIAREMSWSAATAGKYRQRGPEQHGLPEPDAVVGRTPVWFRVTFEQWRASRPGRGVGGGQPAQRSKGAPAPPDGTRPYRRGHDDERPLVALHAGRWRDASFDGYSLDGAGVVRVRVEVLDDDAVMRTHRVLPAELRVVERPRRVDANKCACEGACASYGPDAVCTVSP